jgi:hypothetical protein
MTDTVQEPRKWALTKLDSGDYICPSNNGLTLYRFSSYQDGSDYGLTDVGYRSRTWWRLRTIPRYIAETRIGYMDADELPWDDIGIYESRKEALAAVFGPDR